MNSLLDNYFAWTGSFVEAFQSLVCDVASAILHSFNNLTSNPEPTDEVVQTQSSEVPATAATVAESGEKTSSEAKVHWLFGDVASFFEADEFQLFLLKVFIGILLANLFLIYIAWQIYGERITETFMTPKLSPEDLKKKIKNLKLPTEHSERL